MPTDAEYRDAAEKLAEGADIVVDRLAPVRKNQGGAYVVAKIWVQDDWIPDLMDGKLRLVYFADEKKEEKKD